MNDNKSNNINHKNPGGLKTVLNEKYNFRQLNPLPTEEEIEEIYKKKFASTTRPQFLANKERDRSFWRNVHSRKLKIAIKLLKTQNNANEPKRILDIGCGTGQILEDFRSWNWDIFGVEPSDAFKPILNGKTIPFSDHMFGSIPEKEMGSWGKFDFINMTNLLEHVLEPVEITAKAISLLKKGGILCIDSPNDFNPLQLAAHNQLMLDAWWINHLHINYFNKESLENIMKDLGLSPVYSGVQFPMELFLLFGDNYVENKDLGKKCHEMRVNFEKVLHENNLEGLLIDLYENLAKLDIGRTIAVYGRKDHE